MDKLSIMAGGMVIFSTIRDVIDSWPKRLDLASDLGTSVDRIHKWVRSNTIPPKYHQALLLAAQRRGFDLSADDLVRIHAAPEKDAA